VRAPSRLPEGLEYRGGVLYLGGASLEAAARRFGTPLYLYSGDLVLSRFQALRLAFAGIRPLICYAMKANPSLALGRLLAGAGSGVEVVSGGELWLARRAGFPPDRILFSGLGKTQGEMAEALEGGVLSFNVESLPELETLERVAERLKRRAPVSVRVNPDIDPGTHCHITTGKASNKFGLPVPDALSAFRMAARSPHLAALGLHVHMGSQIFSAEAYRREARFLGALAGRLAREGLPVRWLDVGGGLGVDYGDGKRLDTRSVARAVASLAAPGRRIILEPGRFLVAEAGVLLTRVLYLKPSGRRTFAVVDAGMNDLLRPALYGARHPVAPVRQGGGRKAAYDIVGPICESSDRFGRFRLPEPAPGDVWAVLMAGAYGFSMGSQYNGRPRPAEVLIRDGRAALIRTRERYADLARGEKTTSKR